jgi:hypothetical protein
LTEARNREAWRFERMALRRRQPEERLRAEFLEGAEEADRRLLDRPVMAEELERVLCGGSSWGSDLARMMGRIDEGGGPATHGPRQMRRLVWLRLVPAPR